MKLVGKALSQGPCARKAAAEGWFEHAVWCHRCCKARCGSSLHCANRINDGSVLKCASPPSSLVPLSFPLVSVSGHNIGLRPVFGLDLEEAAILYFAHEGQ